MQEKETPKQALQRELREELNIEQQEFYFIKTQSGYGYWKNETYPILSLFYLADIGEQNIFRNHLNNENSDFRWEKLNDLNPEHIAFDSNKRITQWLKDNFTFDLSRVQELMTQLDPSAQVKEQALYRAIVQGHLVKAYDEEVLIAMGWVFPRQTALRKQAVIEDMIVDEKYRGKGYGRTILKALILWAKNEGCDTIELTTGYHRAAAYKLYESEGFALHETRHMIKKL